MAKATYKDAGVDLEVYAESMARLPRLMQRTYSPRVMRLDGGFAGLFQIDFNNGLFARSYKNPVLVSGTDGVGTKLKLAQLTGCHDTVGIDLVAMCVNDIICCGAEPLFFLDYVAMSHDDPGQLEQIVKGISDGCVEADCALLAGETAIMPDLYQSGDYDLAGFCVGIVEKDHLIDGRTITAEDIVIGVESNGVHSNGFSLVRKVVFEMAGLSVDDQVAELGMTVGEALQKPTKIYARALQGILTHYKVKQVIHGIAHITGGGLLENLERILPDNTTAVIQRDSWNVLPVFDWLRDLGKIDEDEMDRVFNRGCGLVLVVSPYYAENIQNMLNKSGLKSWVIGKIESGAGTAVWK
ncbi:MAG: phosphoribosylformylglycinamidine cyclo-ligase [Planctomycetota bacterium]|nr:phosphoribosylformylglycinamidine cyclo-ligase [Planctomycetota bacterium]